MNKFFRLLAYFFILEISYLYSFIYANPLTSINNEIIQYKIIETLPIKSFAQLMRGPDGYLYGIAYNNYTENNSYGDIYKISTNGKFYTTLHIFKFSDGINPNATLTIGPDNELYGMTLKGGLYNNGTLFKIDINGHFTKLHDFQLDDGTNPDTPLVVGPNGIMYGMTQNGGTYKHGTIYTTDTTGNFIKIHDFNGVDGGAPDEARLVFGPNNKIFGTTIGGGINGFGVVFELSQQNKFTKIYDFPQVQFFNSYSEFLVGPEGDLYGVMSSGGEFQCGALYKISTDDSHKITVLHNFTQQQGCHPFTNLVFDSNQNIYGTTILGGTNNAGTIFKINANNGDYTLMHSFSNLDANPNGLFEYDNDFYGVTEFGYVFQLSY